MLESSVLKLRNHLNDIKDEYTLSWKRLSGIRAKYCPALLYVGFNYTSEKRLKKLEHWHETDEELKYEIEGLDNSTILGRFANKLVDWCESSTKTEWKEVQKREVLALTRMMGACVWVSSDPNDVGYDSQRVLVPMDRRDYLVPLTLDRLNRLTPEGRREFLERWERETMFFFFSYKYILGIKEDEYILLKYGVPQSIVKLGIRGIFKHIIRALNIWKEIEKDYKANTDLIPFSSPSSAIHNY